MNIGKKDILFSIEVHLLKNEPDSYLYMSLMSKK